MNTDLKNCIQKLDSSVIDQISAGEVVERPAGLMKELIENSLDAQARSIEIQFSDGGLFTCVKDDGCGISSDQLSLALSRHATSKIRKTGDLFSIQSYGFRGEALASIASVSVLSLISKTKDSKKAYRLKSEFGKTLKVENINGVQGTTVIVDCLFKNVPARLRFLKSESVETLAIKNVIISQALSRFDVSFRVIHKGRLLFYWPACSSRLQRAEMVLSMKPLYHQRSLIDSYSVEVILSAPNKTEKTSKKMWFFINGRIVADNILYGAIMSAHRNLLMHGEYPIVTLFISIPPTEVDVNIHPTKTKVRFRNQARVFQAVQRTVRELLEKGPWLTHLTSSPKELLSENSVKSSLPVHQEQESFNLKSNFNESSSTKNLIEERKDYKPSVDFLKNFKIEKSFNKPSTVNDKDLLSHQNQLQSIKNLSKTFSSLKVLAQAHQTYLVTQSSTSIVFIDQHAAHERILFEKLISSFKRRKMETQKHLLPVKMELDPAEVSSILSMKSSFQSLGIEIESQHPNEISILSSPVFIKESTIEKAVRQLAHQHIQRGEEFTIEKIVSDIAATMACHSAIRAGQTLSIREMESLLCQMEQFSLSSFCPHGRPVFVEYPLSKLEKDFGRVT